MTAPALRVVAVCDELPAVGSRCAIHCDATAPAKGATMVAAGAVGTLTGWWTVAKRIKGGWLEEDGVRWRDDDAKHGNLTAVTHYVVLTPPSPAEVERVRETVAAWAADGITVAAGAAAQERE